MSDELRERVRARYAEAAVAVGAVGSGCCGTDASSVLEVDERFGAARYQADERASLPIKAVAASLGCGNPTSVAELHPGERVLDLGSGGGLDVILSAKRVGPDGFVFGIDMTVEMIELARANVVEAGARNVEFRLGTIEDVPLPDATVDVVISNCVINLSTDKPRALAEMFRVLAPGGRIGISDVVAEDQLRTAERAERGEYVGCIAGALSQQEYVVLLTEAGFVDVSVRFTHPVADQMHAAVIRATKPALATGSAAASATEDPAPTTSAIGAGESSCCTAVEATSCCEPSAKASCCHTDSTAVSPLPTSCGCR